MYSWHYFVTGGTALAHPASWGGGLHVYAAHPELQMGPVTLAAAAILTAVGSPASTLLGALVMTGLGLLNVRMLVSAASVIRRQPPSARATLIAGLLLIPAWAALSVHYGHLDDVLAITLTVAAVSCLVHDRPWFATVLIALAGAAKPWALPFGLLLLAHPVARGRRAAAFFGMSLLAWIPFLIADSRTLSALGSFAITNAPDSALRALGFAGSSTPSWDRAAQLALATALGLWCLRTGRAVAIPAVVLAARLLLDPGTYPYYTASLLLAVLCVDLLLRPGRTIPWLTVAVTTWFVSGLLLGGVLAPATAGAVRAVFLIALLAGLLTVGRGRGSWTDSGGELLRPRQSTRQRSGLDGAATRLGGKPGREPVRQRQTDHLAPR